MKKNKNVVIKLQTNLEDLLDDLRINLSNILKRIFASFNDSFSKIKQINDEIYELLDKTKTNSIIFASTPKLLGNTFDIVFELMYKYDDCFYLKKLFKMFGKINYDYFSEIGTIVFSQFILDYKSQFKEKVIFNNVMYYNEEIDLVFPFNKTENSKNPSDLLIQNCLDMKKFIN